MHYLIESFSALLAANVQQSLHRLVQARDHLAIVNIFQCVFDSGLILILILILILAVVVAVDRFRKASWIEVFKKCNNCSQEDFDPFAFLNAKQRLLLERDNVSR